MFTEFCSKKKIATYKDFGYQVALNMAQLQNIVFFSHSTHECRSERTLLERHHMLEGLIFIKS